MSTYCQDNASSRLAPEVYREPSWIFTSEDDVHTVPTLQCCLDGPYF